MYHWGLLVRLAYLRREVGIYHHFDKKCIYLMNETNASKTYKEKEWAGCKLGMSRHDDFGEASQAATILSDRCCVVKFLMLMDA